MSELFEAVIFAADAAFAVSALEDSFLPYDSALAELTPGFFAIFSTAERSKALQDLQPTADCAKLISVHHCKSLAVFYDNRSGLRLAQLAEQGVVVAEFGEQEELWAPLDDAGKPILNGQYLRVDELQADEEYDCVVTAIDLGLNRLGVSDAVNVDLLKDVCCYGSVEPIALKASSSD